MPRNEDEKFFQLFVDTVQDQIDCVDEMIKNNKHCTKTLESLKNYKYELNDELKNLPCLVKRIKEKRR
jgi:hypothetical protein